MVKVVNKFLCNTFSVLNEKRKLTIGYFGGSITEGAGAIEPSKSSWRALITSWFRDSYPGCGIIEINAAVGGTGSELGAFRCRNDLLEGKPDLIFIEFAVNDKRKDEMTILRSLEGIVRQIWNSNPDTDIVFVYTVTKEMAVAYENGSEPYSVAIHKKIADYYEIPFINIGKKLWECVKSGLAAWDELLPDSVHPSDKGYKIYTDEIKAFLAEYIAPGQTERQPKASVTLRPREEAKLVDAWELYREPWEKDSNSLAGRYPHMLVCETAGAELEYKFKGRTIGVYWLVAPDSGDIEWSVDGSKPIRQSSWDICTQRYTAANYCIFDDNLENSQHVLKIKLLQEKQPQSHGNWIRIGALLVE
jgi:lysophospholipase L1-like esterase